MKQGEKLLAICSVTAVVILAGAGLRRYFHESAAQAELDAVTNYKFPIAELVALDRDVQARFAVVPTKQFGLERVGPPHGLYQPHTWPEKQTVAALKTAGYEVAFYVMSQRSYYDERGPEGYYPIQGPVLVTSPRRGPQPRWKPYGGGKTQYRDGVPEHLPHKLEKVELMNPEGTPVPTTVTEGQFPEQIQLRNLGFKMFRLSEKVPANQFMGGEAKLANGWQVTATTVRANDKACVKCHQYTDWAEKKSKLGDAFGIAMYVYRKQPGKS